MSIAGAERWRGLCESAQLGNASFSWHDHLVRLYSEGTRHYHTLQHLSECLVEFDAVKASATDPTALELAIWFHDAVYNPKASDNEERSAELAAKFLTECGGRLELIEAVPSLVLATRDHVPTGHPDAPLLIDIDLAILGQPRARFDEYERQIREEYSWVPKLILNRSAQLSCESF